MNAPGNPAYTHPAEQPHNRLVPYLFYSALLVILALLLTLFHGVLTDSVREMKERRRAAQSHTEALQRCAWRPTAGDREACRVQMAIAGDQALAGAHPHELPSLSTDVDPVINAAYR